MINSLVILFLPLLLSFAQAKGIDSEEESYKKQLEGQKKYSLIEEKNIGYIVQSLKLKKNQLTKLTVDEKKAQEERAQIFLELTQLQNAQKTTTDKSSYYKCFIDSLRTQKTINTDCQNTHQVKLSFFEKRKMQKIKDRMTSFYNIEQTKRTLLDEIEELEVRESKAVSNRNFSLSRETTLSLAIKNIEIKRSETSLIAKNEHFINCNEGTPSINLEEKVPFVGADFTGPFYGIPRDNQDGLGTCYANTAKNLLIGLSKGEDNASFLDLALLYKNSAGGLAQDGLDAGTSCHTLAQVEEHGYCPQKYSALETGERSLVGEGLFETEPQSYLALNITLLKNFLQNLEEFQRGKSPIKDELLLKFRDIIEKIKSSPDIQLPLPVARYPVVEEWKLRETYFMHKSSIDISRDEFIDEYNLAYKKFSPIYIKALLDGKNLDEIFELFKNTVGPFINKYKLNNALPELKRVFLVKANEDFKDPRFKIKLRSSLNFLKETMDKKDHSDEDFIEYCSQSSADFKFLASINPLIKKLQTNTFNIDLLFDQQGKLKNPSELMQLTIAPSCLNKSNRGKIKPFSCQDGRETISHIKDSQSSRSEQKRALREKIVLSLVQGYPLGNSFDTGPDLAHINTIVGMRFNLQKKRCEYRIRESQTGTSDWHDEGQIFEKIWSLTEVRRLNQ